MNDSTVCLAAGEDLILRLVQAEDAPALFQFVENNRSYLRQYLGWLDHNQSEEDTLKFIEKKQERYAHRESLTLAIWYNQALVGLVGFQDIDELNRSASIGYWLDESHQGKGIMTRSVRALIDYGRDSLNLHRIEIRCAVGNQKSQAIPLTLGFHHEGVLKDAIWHYDQWLDANLYSCA